MEEMTGEEYEIEPQLPVADHFTPIALPCRLGYGDWPVLLLLPPCTGHTGPAKTARGHIRKAEQATKTLSKLCRHV